MANDQEQDSAPQDLQYIAKRVRAAWIESHAPRSPVYGPRTAHVTPEQETPLSRKLIAFLLKRFL